MFCSQIENLLQFPCDFPIKIMGATHDDFMSTVTEIVLLHAPDFDKSNIQTRFSSKGKYLSVTATVRATSKEQLDNLYLALSSHPLVRIVL